MKRTPARGAAGSFLFASPTRPTTLFPMPRRLAALLALAPALALAVVVGVAAPAAAQAVPGLTATLTVPSSTSVGVSVQATAVFTAPTPPPGPLLVSIRLAGGVGSATLALASNTPGLTAACAAGRILVRVNCNWTPAAGGEQQTLAVTINPVAVSVFSVVAGGSLAGGTQAILDSSSFAITPQQAATTTTTTLVAPTTAPGTPTSAGSSPTSAAAPTSAATAPLPATGGTNANAFIALTVLALGAFLLIIARKVRRRSRHSPHATALGRRQECPATGFGPIAAGLEPDVLAVRHPKIGNFSTAI